MLKNWKNKKTYMAVTGIVLMTTLFAVTSEADYADPGSEADPMVTKTYVDKKVNELKQSLDVKLEKITKDISSIKESNTGGSNQSVSEVFEVLELRKGQIIIADESAEIIVRSGVVHAIASNKGGLSDITEGIDLETGDRIKSNHLLIIPRSDGRGIEIKSDGAFVMIKGKYKVN